jgi:hypothetical protein
MEARMASNEQTGVDSCLKDPKFRDMLKNHSADTDRAYISSELDRVGIVFVNDSSGAKRNAVIDQIVKIQWTQLQILEDGLNSAEDKVWPFSG